MKISRREFGTKMTAACIGLSLPMEQYLVDTERYGQTKVVLTEEKAGLRQIAQQVGDGQINNSVEYTTPQRQDDYVKVGGIVDWNQDQEKKFDAKIGYESDTQGIFVHIGNDPHLPLDRFIEGKEPVVFLEFMNYNHHPVEQPAFRYDEIIAGKYDSQIATILEEAKSYGKPITFILFSEFNGNWNPWGVTVNGNNAEKHIKAFQHIRRMIDSAGSKLIKLAWCPNAGSVPNIPENQMEACYPGKAAHELGVDGFNFGNPDLTPRQLFDEPLVRLAKLDDRARLAIYSTATREEPGKPKWLKELYGDLPAAHPRLKNIQYFSLDKEQKWPVDSGTGTAEAVTQTIRANPARYSQRRVLRSARV